MRTLPDFSASARSSDRFTILDSLTPGAGSNSYIVITGPGFTSTTCPSIPKSSSFFSRTLEFIRRSSLFILCSDGGGSLNIDKGGSLYVPSEAVSENSKCSCIGTASLSPALFRLRLFCLITGSGRNRSSSGSSENGSSSARSAPAGDVGLAALTGRFSFSFREIQLFNNCGNCLTLRHKADDISAGEIPIAITADITTRVKVMTCAPKVAQQPVRSEAIRSPTSPPAGMLPLMDKDIRARCR